MSNLLVYSERGELVDKYIYAVRNKETDEFQNARCHNGGKYYSRKKFAQNRCDEYNSKGRGTDYGKGKFEVVTFKLVEVIGN